MRARLRILTAALMLAVSPSCVTQAMWESELFEDDGALEQLTGKLLLTPFTLLIDLITYPLQEWADGDSGGFDDDC